MTFNVVRGAALAALLSLPLVAPAAAQEFPARDVTIVVGFPAGGGTDLLARIIAEGMSKTLGRRVAVENRGGANAATATRAVARSAADGYTMIFNQTNMAANLTAMKEPGYKWSDFAIVGGLSYSPFVMVANTASSGAKSLKEFVAFGKANPGKLTYASLGPSSTPNIIAQRFKAVSGVGYREIPYKGAAQIAQDLLSGNVDAYFGLPSVGTEMQKQPNMIVLGTSDKKRGPPLSDTPTFTEQGYPEINDVAVAGLWVPAATPKPVLDRLKKAMTDAMKLPEVQALLLNAGQLVYEETPEVFQSNIEKAGERFRDEFNKLGLEAQ
jgi:tripartite-type tricarboxylate transporter receptor subunit TctC